jgi:hypothetical protein
MHGRRERRRQPDAAISVPPALDVDGREKERKRRGRHHMLDAKRACRAHALRPLPGADAAVRPCLQPGYRLTCRIARRRHRDGAQPAGLQVSRNAGNLAVLCLEDALEQLPQRRSVDHALGGRQRVFATSQQPSAPPHGTAGKIAQVDAEHVVDADVCPDLGEVLHLLSEQLRPCGQVCGVDAPRRHASQDVGDDARKLPRQHAEKADLIGGARAAAAQRERQAGPGSGVAHSVVGMAISYGPRG